MNLSFHIINKIKQFFFIFLWSAFPSYELPNVLASQDHHSSYELCLRKVAKENGRHHNI